MRREGGLLVRSRREEEEDAARDRAVEASYILCYSRGFFKAAGAAANANTANANSRADADSDSNSKKNSNSNKGSKPRPRLLATHISRHGLRLAATPPPETLHAQTLLGIVLATGTGEGEVTFETRDRAWRTAKCLVPRESLEAEIKRLLGYGVGLGRIEEAVRIGREAEACSVDGQKGARTLPLPSLLRLSFGDLLELVRSDGGTYDLGGELWAEVSSGHCLVSDRVLLLAFELLCSDDDVVEASVLIRVRDGCKGRTLLRMCEVLDKRTKEAAGREEEEEGEELLKMISNDLGEELLEELEKGGITGEMMFEEEAKNVARRLFGILGGIERRRRGGGKISTEDVRRMEVVKRANKLPMEFLRIEVEHVISACNIISSN